MTTIVMCKTQQSFREVLVAWRHYVTNLIERFLACVKTSLVVSSDLLMLKTQNLYQKECKVKASIEPNFR